LRDAVGAFEAALAAHPAFAKEKRELEALLQQARSGK